MKRILLCCMIACAAFAQDAPRPSLAALENVRNLVASMRQEAIAARDVRAFDEEIESLDRLRAKLESAK